MRTQEQLLESENKNFRRVIKEFFSYLDVEEESDSGRVFHPTYVTSCRALTMPKIGACLKEMRELVNE